MVAATILGLAYAMIAALAMLPTWREQRAKGMVAPLGRLAGVVACLLWPLTLAVVLLALLTRLHGTAS